MPTDLESLMVPTVHLNGTSKQELMKQLLDAWRGVTAAIDLLKHAAPHGRDYYVQDRTGAVLGQPIQKAREQWIDRLGRLESVARELEYIAGMVDDQGR